MQKPVGRIYILQHSDLVDGVDRGVILRCILDTSYTNKTGNCVFVHQNHNTLPANRAASTVEQPGSCKPRVHPRLAVVSRH